MGSSLLLYETKNKNSSKVNKKTLVSVIIPCFNDGKYIDEAVDCILNQTYKNQEIIIVNDGSTDPVTISKLKSWEGQENIIVIHQANTGPVGARNSAIEISKGEYVLPLDADDYFDTSYVEKAVSILDNESKIGVVTCFIKCFGDSQAIYTPQGGTVENFILRPNACGNSMFRKACWQQCGGYNPSMKNGYEDWDLWLGITKNGWKVKVIPEELFFYRRINNKSRDIIADLNRPELIKQLVLNHKDIYQKNIVDFAYNKELEIQNLHRSYNAKINKIHSSLQFKVGKNLLNPLNFLKKLWKKSQ
jgi:glycosyltransferase involved in cell wall biosynthesis